MHKNIYQWAKTGAVIFCGVLLILGSGGGGNGGTSPAPAPQVTPSLPTVATGVVGSTGGTVSYAATSLYVGNSISIPAGALGVNTTITLTVSQGIHANQVGVAFAITPHGTTFNTPVTVTLTFNPAALPAGTLSSQIKLIKQTVAGIQSTASNIIVDLINGTISGTFTSLSNFAVIVLPNNAPVANAGINQNVATGSTVQLNGSGSTDANGNPLTYLWAINTMPAGSAAVLSDPYAIAPTFVADQYGSYGVQLIVNDGMVDSTPATITITVPQPAAPTNTAPVANAGASRTVIYGSTVQLSGSASTDADGNPLSYRWTLTSRPAGSIATLSDPYAVAPIFAADRVGGFTVQLIVNDGMVDSTPATITITVPQPAAPTITSVNRTTASIGNLVTITGSNFLSPAGELPQTTLSKRGGGTINAPIASATAGTVQFTVPTDAASGNITVTQLGQRAVSATVLTITASNSFTLTAGPAVLHLLPANSNKPLFDYSSVINASLQSNNGFTQLAGLTVRGLPAGVTASFDPQQITAGQSARIVLNAPFNQTTSFSTLIIDAYATIEGINVAQSATVDLYVDAVTTSFIGKTVVDDTLETPIAGVTVSMLGQDGYGNANTCSGTAVSDAGGNFALTNLPAACAGTQLVHYNGDTATAPASQFASVDLRYVLIANEVAASPVLVHLPVMSGGEVISIKQNSPTDQVFSFNSEPYLELRVYAGTILTLPNGSKPDPFPITMLRVAVDRLPGQGPVGMPLAIVPSVVAFQPANTHSSLPIAVSYANELNTPALTTNISLIGLDPTLGHMRQYGTGTVSADGTQIIPDIIPAGDPYANGVRRYGLLNLDWNGGGVPAVTRDGGNPENLSPGDNGDDPNDKKKEKKKLKDGDPKPPKTCQPIDYSSGIENISSVDMRLSSNRGSILFTRTYRSMSSNLGPFGLGTRHNYDYRLNSSNIVSTQVINLIRPNGSVIPFIPDGNGNWINQTTPKMMGDRLTRVGTGRMALHRRDGRVFMFRTNLINGSSLLESITDQNGIVKISRNIARPLQITEIIDPVGRKLTLAYDGANRITSITDPMNRTVRYTYNQFGTLASVTDPAGNTTNYTYVSKQVSNVSLRGGAVSVTVVTHIQLTKVTNAKGVVVVINTYDANGRVTMQKYANGGVRKMAYSLLSPSNGRSPVIKTTVTDPMGRVTTYRFNSQGYLSDVTNPLRQTISYERETGKNRLLRVKNYVGNIFMRQSYDAYGNISTRSDLLGNRVSYGYNANLNKPITVSDPLGNKTQFTYDVYGHITSATDANGNRSQIAYDQFGQAVAATDAYSQQSKMEYDGGGNLIALIDAASNRSSLRYDAISRMVESRNALGQVSSKTYDLLNRITTVTNAKGNTTSFTYDALGNLLTVADAKGNTTSFAYDNMNRLMSRTDPSGLSDAQSYDLVGNLISFTDRRRQTTTFAYDDLNRLTQTTYADGSTVQYRYDALSRLVEVIDSISGSTVYGYSAINQLIQSISPTGTINYQYDAAGRLTRRQVVGQSPVDYAYDAVGNLLSATMPEAAAGFGYNALNQLVRQTRSNGVTTRYSYDIVGNLTNITHKDPYGTVIDAIDYTLDAIGNRVNRGNTQPQPLQTQAVVNSIDPINNRLMQHGQSSFTYDANGNRLTEAGANGTTHYLWDARNRLHQITSADGTAIVFSWDFSGNMIGKQALDAAGVEISRETYLVDMFRNVVQQTSSRTGSLSILTLPGIDTHLAAIQSTGRVTYGLQDGLNSTVATSDAAGVTTARFAYEPFGATTAGGDFPFQFTGRTPVTGSLYYYRARFYDTGTGQFISEDPIGFGGGDVNLYRYVGNGGTGQIDPTGLANRVKFLTWAGSAFQSGWNIGAGVTQYTEAFAYYAIGSKQKSTIHSLRGALKFKGAWGAYKRSRKLLDEALNECSDKESFKNLYGLLPFGENFDDISEPTPVQWMIDNYNKVKASEWVEAVGQLFGSFEKQVGSC